MDICTAPQCSRGVKKGYLTRCGFHRKLKNRGTPHPNRTHRVNVEQVNIHDNDANDIS